MGIGNINVFEGYFNTNPKENLMLSCGGGIVQNFSNAKFLLLEDVIQINKDEFIFHKHSLKEVKYHPERRRKQK